MAKTKSKVTPPATNNLFDKIISQGRDRKRSQNLAQAILSSKSRTNVASNTPRKNSSPTGPLLSRAGVKKTSAVTPPKGPSLASRISSPAAKGLCTIGPPKSILQAKTQAKPKPGSLAARMSTGIATANGPKGNRLRPFGPPPGTPTGPSSSKPARRTAPPTKSAVQAPPRAQRPKSQPPSAQAVSRAPAPKAFTPSSASAAAAAGSPGLSIRGIAGPFSIIAKNFAPGTTAADISSAMSPIGGEIISCELLVTSPIIVAELVFAAREGAENVIARFHNQTADGRTLQVFAKPGGYVATPPSVEAPRFAAVQVIDGSNGFAVNSTAAQTRLLPTVAAPGLYSDDLMTGVRKGRGFGTWSSAW